MALTIEEVLTHVRGRRGRMGVKTALDYLGAIGPCLEDGRCKEHMASLGDPLAWQKAVDAAGSCLVYDDDETVIDGGLSLAKWGDAAPTEPTPFGLSKKLPGEPTPLACMDFEAVITSSRKDRVGDVLESAGATLDPRSPLLYMHIPFEVPGRLVRQLTQNSKRLTGHLAIMDSPLGQDCARMVEFGALRISHGFRPTEYELLDEDEKGDWRAGFWIKKFEIHEVSLVSVPANIDAVITLHDRQKMLHPLNVAWGARLKSSLPDVVVGGWGAHRRLAHEQKSCGCGGAGGSAGAAEAEAALLKEYESAEAVMAEDGPMKPYPNEHACRIADPGKFQKDSFRRSTRKHDGKSYGVIMGKMKGDSAMKEQSYRYPKKDWSADEAKAHCKDHEGGAFEPAGESSAEPPEKKDGQAPRPKISRKNLSRLREADEYVAKVAESDIPKPEKTLLASARAALGDVIKDGENAQDDPPEGAGGKSIHPERADVLAAKLAAAIESGDAPCGPLATMLRRRLDEARDRAIDAEFAAFIG